MNKKKTRRVRLEVKKVTLRTLSSDEVAQVHGGITSQAHTVNLNASRYCLDTELP